MTGPVAVADTDAGDGHCISIRCFSFVIESCWKHQLKAQ